MAGPDFSFCPPLRINPLFLVLWLYLLYQYARVLENEWGEFRFCLFYLIGALATVLTSLFVVHAPLSNVPLNTTLFLAFATLYPEFSCFSFLFYRSK